MNALSKKAIGIATAAVAVCTLGTTAAMAAQPVGSTASNSATTEVVTAPAFTESNGRDYVFAWGVTPHGGEFEPVQELTSSSQGVKLSGNDMSANLELDQDLQPGMARIADDIPYGKYALALLDPQSGMVLRLVPADPSMMYDFSR